MAIKRTSSNSISNAVKLSTGFASAAIPDAPTIGTATATSDVAATVTYTAAVLGATGNTFTATSNPSSITGTGASPITVTGLTASTSYTFSVTAGNANGTSAASSASNSVTTSAPSGSFESIASYVVGAGGNTDITFNAIPQTFKHLQVRIAMRTISAIGAVAIVTLNGDTGSNYSLQAIDSYGYRPQGGGPYASATANSARPAITFCLSNLKPGVSITDFYDYTNTSKYKSFRGWTGYNDNGNGELSRLFLFGNMWRNNSAITTIKIDANGETFKQDTTIALYGIKG